MFYQLWKCFRVFSSCLWWLSFCVTHHLWHVVAPWLPAFYPSSPQRQPLPHEVWCIYRNNYCEAPHLVLSSVVEVGVTIAYPLRHKRIPAFLGIPMSLSMTFLPRYWISWMEVKPCELSSKSCVGKLKYVCVLPHCSEVSCYGFMPLRLGSVVTTCSANFAEMILLFFLSSIPGVNLCGAGKSRWRGQIPGGFLGAPERRGGSVTCAER